MRGSFSSQPLGGSTQGIEGDNEIWQQALGDRCKLNAPRLPLEERRTDLRLKALDVRGHGAGGDAKFFRGRDKAAEACRGLERPKGVQRKALWFGRRDRHLTQFI